MRMQLCEQLECSVCRQPVEAQRVIDDGKLVALGGAAPFAQCPCCGQGVPRHGDPRYRRRARRWMADFNGGQLFVVLYATNEPTALAAVYLHAQTDLPQFELLLIDRAKDPEAAEALCVPGYERFLLVTGAPPESYAELRALNASANYFEKKRPRGVDNTTIP
jgi:hypothetical protein